MNDLFERVLNHIEGTETEIQKWETNTGTESYSVSTFGPDRWVERAALGRLMAIDVLSVVLFSVRDSFNLEDERRIIDGWAVELRKAATNGHIQARDPVTLLALGTLPDGWEWLVSIADADKFVCDRGMTWKCAEQVEYLLEQTRKAGTQYKDPKTAQLMKHYWLAGYEPKKTDTQPQPAPEAAPAGSVTIWTPERKAEARAMRNKLRSEGVRDFTSRTAGAYGVSASRLNMVLGEKPLKEKPKRRAGVWNI